MDPGERRPVVISQEMSGLLVFERPLSTSEAFGLIERWVSAQGRSWREVECELDRRKVGSTVFAKRVMAQDEVRQLGGWVEQDAHSFDLRNTYARSGTSGPSVRMDCMTVVEDRSAPAELLLAVADVCGPLRFGGMSYGQAEAVPHVAVLGYARADDPALRGYVPGYPWLTILGAELVAALSEHRRLADFPGLSPFELSQGAMVFRATEDPLTVTPELLVALREYFLPMFPPPGPRTDDGSKNPLAFTAEDLEVLYERYGRRLDRIEATRRTE